MSTNCTVDRFPVELTIKISIRTVVLDNQAQKSLINNDLRRYCKILTHKKQLGGERKYVTPLSYYII